MISLSQFDSSKWNNILDLRFIAEKKWIFVWGYSFTKEQFSSLISNHKSELVRILYNPNNIRYAYWYAKNAYNSLQNKWEQTVQIADAWETDNANSSQVERPHDTDSTSSDSLVSFEVDAWEEANHFLENIDEAQQIGDTGVYKMVINWKNYYWTSIEQTENTALISLKKTLAHSQILAAISSEVSNPTVSVEQRWSSTVRTETINSTVTWARIVSSRDNYLIVEKSA